MLFLKIMCTRNRMFDLIPFKNYAGSSFSPPNPKKMKA